MATETPLLNDLTQIMASLKSHKRYWLRSTAIVSIIIGSVLNFVSLLAVFIDSSCGNAPRYLTVWTSIVVSFPTIRCQRPFELIFSKARNIFPLELRGSCFAF